MGYRTLFVPSPRPHVFPPDKRNEKDRSPINDSHQPFLFGVAGFVLHALRLRLSSLLSSALLASWNRDCPQAAGKLVKNRHNAQ